MIKIENLIIIIFSSIIFFATLLSVDKFKDGDIIKYKKVYDFFYADQEVRDKYFSTHTDTDIWGNQSNTKRDYYSKYLTSQEHLHYVLIYFFSFFLNYEFFLSLLNFLFVFVLLNVLKNYNVNLFISTILIFTNYYVLILYFSMERLKVGLIILLFLFFYLIKNKKNFEQIIFFGLILTCFAHLQMAIILVSHYFIKILIEIYNFIFKHKLSLLFLFCLLVGLIFTLISYQQILHKLAHVFNKNLNVETLFSTFVKIAIFYILSIFYSHRKYHIYISAFYISTFLISILIGGDRLVIFCFFFFLIFGLKNNRGLNFGVLLISSYFLIKSYSAYYSFNYCHSLNYSIAECRIMYNNPYTRIVLNHPNISFQNPIHPSDPLYKQKFYEGLTYYFSLERNKQESLSHFFETLE